MNYVLTENAVRKIKRAITPRLGDGLAPTGGPATISPDTYPAPFTVRWAASLAEPESSEGAGDATEGEWIIYLPTTSLVVVGPTAIDVAAILEAADGYPSGWYVLATTTTPGQTEPIIDRDTGGTLYLNITLAQPLSATFSNQSGGSGQAALKICTASVDSTTGARRVKQFVSSSITIGSGAAGLPTVYEIITDNSGSGGTERKHFTNRYFEVSGVLVEGPDATITSSMYGTFVAILIQGNNAQIMTYGSFAALQAEMQIQSQMVLPLYKLDATGSVQIDLRHIPRADAWSLTLTSGSV